MRKTISFIAVAVVAWSCAVGFTYQVELETQLGAGPGHLGSWGEP